MKAFDLLRCVFVRQLLNFDTCRLKKMRTEDSRVVKFMRTQTSLRPSTRNSAFPRAL